MRSDYGSVQQVYVKLMGRKRSVYTVMPH